jgi:putative transposase
MKKSKFTETQIVNALKEYEAGKSVADICRELGVNKQTFYNWNKKYGGMETQDLQRLKELEQKYSQLQRMYADLAMDNKVLKDVLSKKF